MSKSKRMATLKHRRRKKKLEEKRKALVAAGGPVAISTEPVAKQAGELIQPELQEPKMTELEAEVAQIEAPAEPEKKTVKKKKVEAKPEAKVATAEVSAEPKKKTVRKK